MSNIFIQENLAFCGIITKNKAEQGRPYIMEHMVMKMKFYFLTDS